MKTFRIFLLGLLLASQLIAKADEGMWLPLLIAKYNLPAMQKMGLQLTAEQIYSVNQACLKDAIVSLDHGNCSGSIISEKGLLITNHHCGYEAIADQSSVNSDYLTNGFWAMRAEEELPIPGKTISFLVRMEDVTSRVLEGISDTTNAMDRQQAIDKAISQIESEAVGDTGLETNVESMFEGNEYYLFVYQTFKDVRLVAAPPSSIGKFGGETDNWMWPRHTGDFCLLRVYSGSDGKPADYNKSNVPLKPNYCLPVSLRGIREGDFSMILGYPGSTDRYLTSYGIKEKLEIGNPAEIKAKAATMEVMKKYMDADDATRIAYAGDYAYLANFWKKALQESRALIKLHVYDDKKKQEDAFMQWLQQNDERKKRFGHVLPDLDSVYVNSEQKRYGEAITYLQHLIMGSRIFYGAYQFSGILDKFGTPQFADELNSEKERALKFYKEFNPALEKEMLVTLLQLYVKNVSPDYWPEVYKTIAKKYKASVQRYVDHVFNNSIFASAEAVKQFFENPSKKRLTKDPALALAGEFLGQYMYASILQMQQQQKFDAARRDYIAGLQAMQPGKVFYPDANSTMRLTYAEVKPYKGADAIYYDYRTTLEGVMEKEDPGSEEFLVPQKLKDLFAKKDFEPYGENGQMPVCFLTTHDITGGNSGSPVMNGKGELIGVAFDGNSEAMSSDIKYDAALQRTICVDIRYVLFIVDKFAGAGYLVEEIKKAGN